MKNRTFAFSDKILKFFGPKKHELNEDIDSIKSLLLSDKPCMISRIGSVEFQALTFMRYYPFSFFLKKRSFYQIKNNAGFFPVSMNSLKDFYKLYKDDIKDLDVLVRWRIEELLFSDWFKNKQYVFKPALDYFFLQEHPWTYALKGKRILVIHPFAETIKSQYYYHRTDLFENKEILPEFESLQTIKAVQSNANNPSDFTSWFDALSWMESEIDKIDYDIALLGCGAYGMPLAAYIKRKGKKAIHMGGILQFLFGIKSIRYEGSENTSPYINNFFVYPSDAERPKNANLVEGGCYWGPESKNV